MKKILVIITIALAFCGATGCRTQLTPEQKALKRATDSIAYVNALQAIDNLEFIIPATTAQINGRSTKFTDNTLTNFICVHDGKAIVQLASMSNPRMGSNGLGGFTVEGNISLVRSRVSKKGERYYEFSIHGALANARMVIRLPKDGIRASATITGNFSGRDLTVTGDVTPYSWDKIHMGRSL